MIFNGKQFDVIKKDSKVTLMAEASTLRIGKPLPVIAIISTKTSKGVRFWLQTEEKNADNDVTCWKFSTPYYPNLFVVIFND